MNFLLVAIAVLIALLSMALGLFEHGEKRGARPLVISRKGRAILELSCSRCALFAVALSAMLTIVGEFGKSADDRNKEKADAQEKRELRELLTNIQFEVGTIRENTKSLTSIVPALQDAIEKTSGALNDALVDPRYGLSTEVGQMAEFGYDTAKDIERVVRALSRNSSSFAGVRVAFGQRDGGEEARKVAEGLGVNFNRPTAVHLMGTFAINNFGGLGESL